MEAYVAGSGYPAVKMGDLKKHRIPIPPLEEQRKIATVLYTVDQAIQKTEEITKQLRRVRSGILNDLFTRGIDSSGKPRSLPQNTPSLYSEKQRYTVPQEWSVASLQDLCDKNITYGIVQAGPHVDQGVPYIKTGDMTDGDVDINQLSRTSEEVANDYARSEIREGELVTTIRATVGVTIEVPAELDGANLTQGTARISPSDSIDNRFLLWAIRSSVVQSQITARLKGTTFDEITLGQLRKVPIPFPEQTDEQKKIASELDTATNRLETEERYLSALRRIKQGLMQDLLSGEVRTDDVDIAVLDDVLAHG